MWYGREDVRGVSGRQWKRWWRRDRLGEKWIVGGGERRGERGKEREKWEECRGLYTLGGCLAVGAKRPAKEGSFAASSHGIVHLMIA